MSHEQELRDSTPTSKRLALTKTELPPCCLRVHPNDASVVLVGTYDLNKQNNTRVGTLEVLKLDRSNELIKISSYRTSGAVLDMKFSPFNNDILVTCHSTGNIMVWNCQVISGSIYLSIIADEKLFDESILCTSINFSPVMQDLALITLTDGRAATVKLTQTKVIAESVYELPSSHSLECWTGAFGSQYALENVVFTGGDDASVIAHDLRQKRSDEDSYGEMAIFKTGPRLHDAGVVAIMPSTKTHNGVGEWNISAPYSLWTGSYDDHLRTLDLRAIPPQGLIQGVEPLARDKLNLGGGVWRLIPSPVSNDDRLLTCCMYDGARIINSHRDTPKVERYFKGDHESMCYGGDWSNDGKYVVTCSFYDNVVQVWSPDA